MSRSRGGHPHIRTYTQAHTHTKRERRPTRKERTHTHTHTHACTTAYSCLGDSRARLSPEKKSLTTRAAMDTSLRGRIVTQYRRPSTHTHVHTSAHTHKKRETAHSQRKNTHTHPHTHLYNRVQLLWGQPSAPLPSKEIPHHPRGYGHELEGEERHAVEEAIHKHQKSRPDEKLHLQGRCVCEHYCHFVLPPFGLCGQVGRCTFGACVALSVRVCGVGGV